MTSSSCSIQLGPLCTIISDGKDIFLIMNTGPNQYMLIELNRFSVQRSNLTIEREYYELEHSFPLIEEYKVPIGEITKLELEVLARNGKVSYITQGKDFDIDTLLLKNKSVLDLMRATTKKLREREQCEEPLQKD